MNEHERDLLSRAEEKARNLEPTRFASWLRGYCQPAQRGDVRQSDEFRRELIRIKRECCGR